MSTATLDVPALVRRQREPEHDSSLIRTLKTLIMRNATDDQIGLAKRICDRYGFDPFLKHIVFIGGNLYVTRDGLLDNAHRSGQFDGIEVVETELVDGAWVATVRVWRKDMSHPFTYTAHQREHENPQSPVWVKAPRAMTVKCFDDETEVLTDRGFQRFAETTGRVLMVTPRGLEPTDAQPFSVAYGGDMVTLDSDDLNFRVTPNHDMVTTEGKVEAGDVYDRARMRARFWIPRCVGSSKPGIGWSHARLELAAAYLSDGADLDARRFAISVSRPAKVEHLEQIGLFESVGHLKAAGTVAHTRTRTITTRSDKVRFVYDRQTVNALAGPAKVVDRDVLLLLSRDEARTLVDAWIAFDGSTNKRSGVRRFYTSRVDHLDAFEVAAVAAGYTVSRRYERTSDISTRPNYWVTISSRSEIPVIRHGRPYRGVSQDNPSGHTGLTLTPNDAGVVWCVTVPSGEIVVRRHGFSMRCGNCAEVMALRRAFNVSLGAAEEIGVDDGVSPAGVAMVDELPTTYGGTRTGADDTVDEPVIDEAPKPLPTAAQVRKLEAMAAALRIKVPNPRSESEAVDLLESMSQRLQERQAAADRSGGERY